MKIPTEDFTVKTLVINDTYGSCAREIVVLIMEVDKVADEVTDMEVDKVTDMKIPIEDLTDVILAIGDPLSNTEMMLEVFEKLADM